MIAGMLAASVGAGCKTRYVRIGKPAPPPPPPAGLASHVQGLYENSCIAPGDVLEVHLFQQEDYMDTIHDLRGDPK